MPPPDSRFDLHKAGDFGDTSEQEVRERMRPYSHVVVQAGTIPCTFERHGARPIALLHLDVDLYRSVQSALSWCYPRMIAPQLSLEELGSLARYERPLPELGSYDLLLALDASGAAQQIAQMQEVAR